MPSKPKKPCAYPGCPALVTGRYCEEHAKKANSDYEKFSRDKNTKHRYGRAWKRIRDKYVSEHPFCEKCYERGVLVPVEEIHHKRPLSEGGTHDRSNLIALCNGQLYYEYYMNTDDAHTMKGTTVRLQPHDVLHIPGLGFDGLVGYSPIAMAKNAIGMAIACEEYGAKFFANGAAPSGVLEHPGTIKDPSRVRESWQATFGGSANANKVAVLEEGMKYTPISISPNEAQFLETRKFQIDEIARIFRVPPHMVGDLEKSSFSNIEQQSLEFVKYTLDPWVARWEQAMVRALLTQEEKKTYFFKFNVDGLLRGDYQSRMNGYATARQNGWMSANDIRELENLDRIPAEAGGDLYLINGNMTKLEDAGIFAAGSSDGFKGKSGDSQSSGGEEEDLKQSDGRMNQSRGQPGRMRNDGGCTDATKKDGGK